MAVTVTAWGVVQFAGEKTSGWPLAGVTMDWPLAMSPSM